jgi:hypothetical protein
MALPSVETLYKGAWDEAVSRVVARDRIMLAYVSLAATLLGVAAKADGVSRLAVAVPYLTLVAGCLIAHHDLMISRLNSYMRQLAGTERTWHTDQLGYATGVGFVFVTVPMVSAFGLLSYAAIGVAKGVVAPGSPLSLLVSVGEAAGWAGVIALAVGRLGQVFVGFSHR